MFIREKLLRLVVTCILLVLLSLSLSTVLQSKEPLTFAIGSTTWREPREEQLFFQEWQRRTGVQFKLMKMDASAINEKINTMLASGDLPDIMSCPRGIANDYGPQGAFIPINKYFDKAPNLKRHFDVKKNPWLYGPDGNIYILTATWPYLEWGWVWNRKWADKLGLSVPKTTEDWVTAWEKVRASDPKAIPLATRGTGLLYQFFFPTWWGITSESLVMQRGILRDPWLTPEMKSLITFFRDIYDKKLLYQEFLDDSWENLQSLIAQGRVFSVIDYQGVAYVSSYPKDILDANEPVPPPKGPYGKSGCDWMGPTSWWGISITSKCKDVDAAIKLLDYLFSKEGTYFYYLGVRGLTYEIAKDGTIKFTQRVFDEAKKANLDPDTYLARNYGFNLFFINIPPWDPKLHISHLKALGHNENYLKGLAIVAKNLAKLSPPVWLTTDEQKRVNSLMANISTYREEWVTKFILGKEPLTKWDEFISGLKKMGLEEVDQLRNRGYERYLKSVGKPKGYVPQVKYDLINIDKLVGLSK
jgi:putative aldouronate transport system substrate-binding protein